MTETSPPLNPPTPELIRRLAEITGPAHALTNPDLQRPYLIEWRDKYVGRSPLILRPGKVDEVSKILALCHSARVGVVPQAGNTGLVGGQIPFEHGHEIVISVERLTRIRRTDAAGGSMVAEAGVTLADVHTEAEGIGRLFPLSMGSEGSCRIGGNLATNAGGTAVLAYGNARQLVYGLEVVMADGRVWDGLRTLKKDNTGYDLKQLFIGSEGTLGIITAAALKLAPRPAETATALSAVPTIEAVGELFRLAETRARQSLTAFEFLSETALAFVKRHGQGVKVPPIAVTPWTVLIEISGGAEDGRAASMLEAILAEAMTAGTVIDTALAASPGQSRDLWKIRECVPGVQKSEGGSIKHDVSVPIASIAEFIGRADVIVDKVCPGARPVPFGHFGDGNVHYNVSQPVDGDKALFLARWDEVQEAIHALVHELGGSISAEHGIGRMKREEMARRKSPVEIDLMRQLKRTFDPHGILNPGKVV